MVQLILRRDVEDLGSAGDLVDVRPGYARNYLVPQGMAFEATEKNLRRLEEERGSLARAAERELEGARELAAVLEGTSVTLRARAGEEGRLFGSVTTADVAEALAADGKAVDRHKIVLEEPMKQLGVYKVRVRLHADVQPELTVWVVGEE